jgi:hypothetical protein
LIAGQVKRKQDLTQKLSNYFFFSLGKTTAIEKKLYFYQVLKVLNNLCSYKSLDNPSILFVFSKFF